MAKVRADVLLVEQGLADTRAKAAALILAGAVSRGAERLRIDKPGLAVPLDAALFVRGEVLPFVSRGGLKLTGALDAVGLDPSGLVCLDVGASTGGFTDCLLQRGAKRVYALDVGYGQLAWSLRQDPRVVVVERTNIRTAPDAVVPEPIDLVVIDVSFISLKMVLPHLGRWLRPQARLVALIKPQFEAGRSDIGKGGIVRSDVIRGRVLDEVVSCANGLGFVTEATLDAPIAGAKGNRELLLVARFAAAGPAQIGEGHARQ